MAKYGPASAFLLVQGLNISADTWSLDEQVESLLEEVHGLSESWERSLPVGLARTTLDASGGLWDDRTAGINEALQSKGQTDQLVAYGLASSAIGKACVLLDGAFAMTWKRIASREALTKANAQYRVTGAARQGLVVHGLTAESTDPGDTKSTSVDMSTSPFAPWGVVASVATGNPTPVTTKAPHGLTSSDVVVIAGTSTSPGINGQQIVTVTGESTFTVPVNTTSGQGTEGGTWTKAAGAGGAVVALHVPALTLGGFTNVAIDVLHSTDNAVFTTLTSFTNVTALGAEKKTVTGTVNRYVAMQWNFTGSGSGQSIIPFVAISR